MKTPAKQLDFSGQKFYIGIDVHEKNWSVTIRTNHRHLKTFSMNSSPDELSRYLKKQFPGGEYYSVYEAGFCGFWIHRELVRLGINNIVINAADVPSTHKEKDRKRDKVDSKKLARELESGSLQAIYIPNEVHQQLRGFCRLRYQIVRNQTRVKNRIKSFLYFNGVRIPPHAELSHWSGAFIRWLRSLEFSHPSGKQTLECYLAELEHHRKQLADITRTLRRYSREYGFAPIVKLLLTVPGIGFVIAITLYTEMIDIERFRKFDNLASFIGLVPSTDGSGEEERDTHLTSRMNRYLLYLLIEASWVAIREDPALTLKFNELCKRMKKQEAIIRIAKKLLSRIRYAWKNQKEYVKAVVQ